jgi:hypothetical protein
MRVLAFLLALLLAGCSASTRLEAETIARGSNSGIRGQVALLITAPEAWASHWRRHATIFVPPPSPPPFDFAKGSLVAIHLGERRTGGYSVTVTEIRQKGKELTVTAVERRPPPGAIVTMALTQPYQIVRIPPVKAGTRLRVDWQAAPQSAPMAGWRQNPRDAEGPPSADRRGSSGRASCQFI